MKEGSLIVIFFSFFLTGADLPEVTLKEYVDKNIASLKELIEARFDAAQVAIDKFEEDNERWRENANEWRGQSNDRETAFALKSELQSLREDVSRLQLSEATLAGKASQNTVNVALVISIISIGVGVFSIFRKH